jgi:hypothetical protein
MKFNLHERHGYLQKMIKYIVCFIFLTLSITGGAIEKHRVERSQGMVPDERTAIAIAVLEPIYGADKIAAQRPFHATLRNGIWYVDGTLVAGMRGGAAVADINRKDGRILLVSHGQ